MRRKKCFGAGTCPYCEDLPTCGKRMTLKQKMAVVDAQLQKLAADGDRLAQSLLDFQRSNREFLRAVQVEVKKGRR